MGVGGEGDVWARLSSGSEAAKMAATGVQQVPQVPDLQLLRHALPPPVCDALAAFGISWRAQTSAP